MKPFRLLLIGAAVLGVLLVAAVVTAFNSRFQTWAVRRALASRPTLHATVDSVSAGLGRVELKGLRVESHGAVLTLPSLVADLPLFSAGVRDKVLIARLTAKGWTLDLTKAVKVGQVSDPPTARPAALAIHEFSLLSSARAADSAAAPGATTAQVFRGIFSQLQLPFDLSLDGVDLAGEVILPASAGQPPGRLRLTLTGGGLAAGREGRFLLALDAATTASGTAVDSVVVRSAIVATMDSPRTFTRLGAKADAMASGAKFPLGVKLTADLVATRAGPGENYTLTLATGNKQLLAVQAAYPNSANRLDGEWKLDVHDADLTPFLPGIGLPAFEATGEGRFDADAAFAGVHGIGRLAASADNLAVLRPELAAMGTVRLAADFDLARNGDAVRVERMDVSLSGARPVATVQSRQGFTFNARTRELKADDAARELFSVMLQAVPLAWVQPFVKDLSVSGGDIRGEFAATAHDGGFTLRSKAPLTSGNVSAAQPGKPLLRAVDLSAVVAADYTPKAWQAEVAPLTARTAGVTLLTLDARAGQLAGVDQAVKAAGKFSASLPAMLTQPVAAGAFVLVRGDATGEFAASLDAQQSLQAKLAFTNLATDPKLTKETLPSLSAEVRADRAADGTITLNAPLLIERDGRKSDLAVTGTLQPGKGGIALDAHVVSERFVVDDAKLLTMAVAPGPATASSGIPAQPAPRSPDAAPPWAGVSGQLTLAMKQVLYSDTVQVSDVTGTLRLDAGAVKLEKFQAGLGNGAEAKLAGGVTFDAKSASPYALAADLAVNEFDPAPLFKALNPGQPATVEGKFTVISRLAGEAAHLADFSTATHGDFQLTSKGGVFRGLPVNVATKNEAVGKLAAGVALVGSAFDVFKGRKDDSEITSTAKAVTEVSKMFAAIPYDQLSVVVTRDAALNTVLKDFTLISPEMRLTGGGQTKHQAGAPLLDETLAMEFKLRARGYTAELFKKLGKLEPQSDELGYAACTLPLKVGGTLGRPDTSELSNELASLAVEKSGMLDKAGDLLKGLIPGGK